MSHKPLFSKTFAADSNHTLLDELGFMSCVLQIHDTAFRPLSRLSEGISRRLLRTCSSISRSQSLPRLRQPVRQLPLDPVPVHQGVLKLCGSHAANSIGLLLVLSSSAVIVRPQLMDVDKTVRSSF